MKFDRAVGASRPHERAFLFRWGLPVLVKKIREAVHPKPDGV
jgi:hypothetical protein